MARTKEERRARYCYLRMIGANRLLARRICGWSDEHQRIFLENYWNRIQLREIFAGKTAINI
jgi:hypothetical protein